MPQREDAETEELLSLPTDEFLAKMGATEKGLTAREARARLRVYGYNELAKRRRRFIVFDFLLHFNSPLVITLLIAGLISALVGEPTDATLIFIIVLVSGVLDFYQEYNAERAAEMLQAKVATTATVLREGTRQEVRLSEVVPGDVIYLSAGDVVPADARVIAARDLSLDQSALTGESFPVEKLVEPLQKKGQDITEWSNCLFMGTSVVGGSGTAILMKTGALTEYGRIVENLLAREPEKEFERGLRRFGLLIAEAAIVLVLFVFVINAFFRHDILEALLFSVALAVGLVPELLPMMLSVNLSKGALAMSKRGVIVKRLASIQDLGSMDVLCTDKTGTLTQNKIALWRHVDIDNNESEDVFLYCYLNSFFETGLKSPLDEAALEHEHLNIDGYTKIDEIPFDFVRRRVSVVVKHDGERMLVTKGAPEEVFKVCSRYLDNGKVSDLSSEVRDRVEVEYERLSGEGFRALGIAYRPVNEQKQAYTVSEEKEMVLVGFAAFVDPPKETARESLKLLKNAGIELKILTGDNELVTRHVCEQLEYPIKGLVTGTQIGEMHDDALARIVERTNIFVRVSPAQKNRIINALKANRHAVGYLGDGINDAPSMKAADVAISVDNAVDVAKESADMILLQKSLRVLHDGVLEGRKVFANTMKYVMMGTSSSFGNMFSVAGGSLFLPFLPMLPIQILLNNLMYESSQAAIPTDSVDEEYVASPKRWDISFIRRFMLVFGPISSLYDFLTYFIMLYLFKAPEPLFQTAWFVESFCTQTLVIFLIRTRRTPFYKSRPGKVLTVTSLVAVAAALLIPSTPIGDVFGFVRLPVYFFVVLAVLVGTYLMLVEVFKGWFYRRYSDATL